MQRWERKVQEWLRRGWLLCFSSILCTPFSVQELPFDNKSRESNQLFTWKNTGLINEIFYWFPLINKPFQIRKAKKRKKKTGIFEYLSAKLSCRADWVPKGVLKASSYIAFFLTFLSKSPAENSRDVLIHLNFKLTSAWISYLKFWVSFLAVAYTSVFLIFYFSSLFTIARFQQFWNRKQRHEKKIHQFFLLSIKGKLRGKGSEKQKKREQEIWAKEQALLFLE